MPENWDAYLADMDGKVASFFVDLGLKAVAPISKKEWSFFIRIPLLHPSENGLTQTEEFTILQSVEKAILEALEAENPTYAGRVTTDGTRTMVFYSARELNGQELLASALQRFPEYTCETWSNEDADWHFYKCTLYPHPEEMQIIKNNRVLEALEEHGDDLMRAREVAHWMYFKKEADRAAFVESVQALGYRTECKMVEAADRYCVIARRIESVSRDSIHDTILQLFRLAHHHEGEYDGWETSVETDNPRLEQKRPWWKKLLKK